MGCRVFGMPFCVDAEDTFPMKSPRKAAPGLHPLEALPQKPHTASRNFGRCGVDGLKSTDGTPVQWSKAPEPGVRPGQIAPAVLGARVSRGKASVSIPILTSLSLALLCALGQKSKPNRCIHNIPS